MKRSQAIKNLLVSSTHADLAALYDSCMEVQVNVAQGNGERVDRDYRGKQYQCYSDSISVWNHFRIPHNAKTIPENNDYEISYNLAEHCESIGLSGWDWQNQQSRWVAFDFDAISGHAESHTKKLNNVELLKIQEAVSSIPWVTTRLSTGGKGLPHVFLKDVATENHVEHAAVARSILGLLSGLTGNDLKSSVDAVGGNMWIFSKRMIGTNGLSLIKQGTVLEQVPANWRDHIGVINNRSKRMVPAFVSESGIQGVENLFEELTNSKTKIPLDAEHQRLIKFLHETNACAWFDQDNHMLVTHTIHLQEAFHQLGLRGIFKTIATGSEKGADHNSFCYPMRDGAWVIRRYTPGVAEDPSWSQDKNGYTRCYLNREPELQDAARARGAIENTSGGFIFREAEVAVSVAKDLGIDVQLPRWILTGRDTQIKYHKDGRLIFRIKHADQDRADDMLGWLPEKGFWTKIFSVPTKAKVEPEVGNYDNMIRHLLTESGEDCGWTIKTESHWRSEPLVHVKTWLASLDLKSAESTNVLGSCIGKPWQIVCQPFQPVEPGNRLWNRNAPQLAYIPTKSDNLSYPTWLKILNHLGSGLDDAVKEHAWCRENGIICGADYLTLWIASLIKEPASPLPYLYLYSSEQNTGKTSLHEAIGLLVTSGVVRADAALTSSGNFNGELENSILAVVEETDMRKNHAAYNKLKDWVTSRTLSIHRKGLTPYSVQNCCHFIQCANDYQACPILPGDSRIVMIEVSPIKAEDLIPKKALIPMLEKEAPDFLGALLALELPISNDRLNIPVVETAAKQFAIDASQSYLEIFINEHVHYVPGAMIRYGDFYEKFQSWLDVDQLRDWSKVRMGRDLPKKYPKGRLRSDNQMYVGNCSWVAKNPEDKELSTLVLTTSGHLESKPLSNSESVIQVAQNQ